MAKLNKRNLNYKRVAREKSREKKGDKPRLLHLATRKKNVSGRRTAKHARRVGHRNKMRERELEELGLVPADGGDADEAEAEAEAAGAGEDAPEPLPHQAAAIAEAVAAAKGGRVKGRARKALRVAGLDPRKARSGKGRAAAAIAAALAARDAKAGAGGSSPAGGAAAGAAAAAAAAGGGKRTGAAAAEADDAMEE